MLSLPTLPTDSLYKFLFVSGIIMIFFGVYLKTFREDDGYDDFWKLNMLKNKKIDSLFDINGIIKKMDDSAERKYREGIKINSDGTKTTPSPTNFVNYPKIFELNKKSYQLKQDSLYYNTKMYLISEKNFNIKNEGLVLIFIGTIIAVFGGLFWYKYIQRPQDKLLSIQIEQLEQAIKNEKNNKIIIIGRKHHDPLHFKKH
jgi:hypothetical protein